MTGKSKRGFASMDQAKQKEIASKGGKAAPHGSYWTGRRQEFPQRQSQKLKLRRKFPSQRVYRRKFLRFQQLGGK